MGEQADYAIQDGMDSWAMDTDDAFDADSYNPNFTPPTVTKYKTCRCCGVEWLHWRKFNDKWRLATEDGKLHKCSVRPLEETKEV